MLRRRVQDAPRDTVALRLLAERAMHAGRLAEAEALLERALALDPVYTAARHLYAATLFRADKIALALAQIELARTQDPRNLAYRILLASCLAKLGETDRALDTYAALLRDAPKLHDIWLNYGQTLKHAGRQEDSAQAFRACLALQPGSGPAWWGLANLGGAPLSPDEIAAMRSHLSAPGQTPENLFPLHYALGRTLELTGDYAESFTHYAAGARLRRGRGRYDAVAHGARVRRVQAFFTAARMAAWQGAGHTDPAPIFVVGMPRGGSTLVEQILSSHSQVEGTQELPGIGLVLRDLADGGGGPYPDCLADMAPAQLAALGQAYLDAARPYRKTDKPFFIDKMLGNWIDTAFIAAILPRAQLIDARRAPMANGFAAFKMYFSAGQDFTYDLTDFGRHYGDYIALMAHFDEAMPGRIHRVTYEAVVTDTEAEIRALLAHCGLPFEPACLSFWETARSVTTASAAQVRRPMFRDSLDQWRHYEPWLGKLRDALPQGA